MVLTIFLHCLWKAQIETLGAFPVAFGNWEKQHLEEKRNRKGENRF
jgi:hypothetical protein